MIGSEKFPRRTHFGLYGTQTNKQDEQINDNGDAKRDEGGFGNVFFGVFDFFGNGGDEVIPFKGDEGKPHSHEHTAHTFGKKGLKVFKGLLGCVNDV